MRTRYAGSLRASDAGTRVELCGWVARRRDHGKVVFLDVRDVEGIVQVVCDPSAPGLDCVHALRSEWVVQIGGEVRLRPGDTSNPDLPTGEVEVAADTVVVLNESEALPFQLDQPDVDEALRLRYRYLDLRRPKMAGNLRLRAKMVSTIRRAMDDQGFLEIETPTLTRSTPEGARDFLVPSRLHPGSFYALPQSPQLFKQLMMVGGLDRYYQVAHCWRDEDLRADRQPEFTQMDAEISFGTDEDVMAFIEVAVRAAITAVTGKELGPLPRITWAEAMSRFGSDKPDVRFGMELADLTSVFGETAFQAFAGKRIVGINASGRGEASRKEIDGWTDRVRSLGAAGLVWLRVKAPESPDDPGIEGPVVKFLTPTELAGLRSLLGAAPGDLLLLVADADVRRAQTVLGALRLDLGRPQRIDDPLALLWVVNFPLFEALGDDGKPIPAHHPFTTPHPDDVDLIDTDPLAVRSLAYDLVINGIELGSGSVRIHDRSLQQRIFGLLGIDEERAQERFGFLLDAFRYGAPPHAGFAFGIDRLAMVLAGEGSLREVIAFPKTQSGSDPLTEAPAPVDDVQLRDLGISHAKPSKRP